MATRTSPLRSAKAGRITLEEVCELAARHQFLPLPEPSWADATIACCERLFQTYVARGNGRLIPEQAFDIPKWHFLEYLARHKACVFHGSPRRDLSALEPRQARDNLVGSEHRRVYASASGLLAGFHALLDRPRIAATAGRGRSSTLSLPMTDDASSPRRRFHIAVDYRLLPQFPWRCGCVYVLPLSDFTSDFLGARWFCERRVRPLARVGMAPHDWPLLGQVRGFDVGASIDRLRAGATGFPWCDDRELFPARPNRYCVAKVRAHLDGHVAERASLADLAELADLSPCHLLRVFRNETGLTPARYQAHARVARAKQLLQDGAACVDVAAATGFADQSHLTRVFRELVGVTPARYAADRKNVQDRR
jgi:AraC-like DNA-binding protein